MPNDKGTKSLDRPRPLYLAGDGLCSEICPDVFEPRADGLWIVKEVSEYFGLTTIFDGKEGEGHGPDGQAGLARIPAGQLDSVIEASEDCPGACIYISEVE